MKEKILYMTKDEYLEEFNNYKYNFYIPEDRIRSYMEAARFCKIVIR